MAALSRRKGRAFEQWLATRLRRAFPGSDVRRGWQAAGPSLPDVYVSGEAPERVRRVWWECQHAKKSTPEAKLVQAERDIREPFTYPVAVTRAHGASEAEVCVTLRLVDFLRLLGGASGEGSVKEGGLELLDDSGGSDS